MVPQHGYDPSPEPPPYTITVDKSTFSPGDNITVSLQVAPSNPTFFKGFLIEARDAGKLDFPAVGSFFLTDPHQSQLLQCGHTQIQHLSLNTTTPFIFPPREQWRAAKVNLASETQWDAPRVSGSHRFFLSFTTDEAGGR
ncbi:putative ferric-chelate reductase 1 isoform X1 [Lates japonicus]|uniref:Ferric-chelate reductase 1 isoform X1 n=1 Tax=Lates japonicus TaxID=270547 RepID=A0AAD3NGE4_LATJO|nr:putative ferric-chelate reductase 1 isoform X1 [Lates japonicus]